MRRWIQGPGIHLEQVAGIGANRLAGAVAVLRAPEKGLQNKEIERALQQLDPVSIPFVQAASGDQAIDRLYPTL